MKREGKVAGKKSEWKGNEGKGEVGRWNKKGSLVYQPKKEASGSPAMETIDIYFSAKLFFTLSVQ